MDMARRFFPCLSSPLLGWEGSGGDVERRGKHVESGGMIPRDEMNLGKSVAARVVDELSVLVSVVRRWNNGMAVTIWGGS